MGKQKEASPVGQTVKNPPAVRKTLVWSLGQEDPLENPMDTEAWQATVHGGTKNQTGICD